MKIKHAGICLIASSLLWMFSYAYRIFLLINMKHSPYDDYAKMGWFILFIDHAIVLIPSSLLVLGIVLVKNDSTRLLEAKGVAQPERNLSLGEWLLTFFMVSIPVLGLILQIIWASDDSNKVRKNWALASLLWGLVMGAIILLLLWRWWSQYKGFLMR